MHFQLVLVIAVALGLFIWFQRTTELFVLSWRKGELRLVRGRVPGMLRGDLAEALRQMKIERCDIVARKEDQRARLSVSGMNDFTAQRLRNIFQLYPISQLRAATAPAHGRLLRWVGLASLVWLFGRSEE